VLDEENRTVLGYDLFGKFQQVLVDLDTGAPSAGGRVVPVALASDKSGALYVGDANQDRVLVFDLDGSLARVLTGYAPGSGTIRGVAGLAVGRRGDIAVSERGSRRIVRLDPTGAPSRAGRCRACRARPPSRGCRSRWTIRCASRSPSRRRGACRCTTAAAGCSRNATASRDLRRCASRAMARCGSPSAARAGCRASSSEWQERPSPRRSRGSRAMIRARLGALLGATLLLACASVARATDDPSCGRMAVAVHAGTLVYRLPHAFLSPGSDSVRTATGVWVRDHDYALDMLHGELRLLREPVPGDTVWVDACWLLAPPPLEAERRHYRPAAPVAAAVPDTAPAVPERAGIARDRLDATSDGMSLNVAGSKMLAVDFGSNQDAALRQSLDLTLSGRLSPTMELTGVLSDHNAPLLAGGSTQDLQAFDRVMLELRSPTLDAQLGDVDVSLAQGEFARVQRRLQGLSAGWRSGGSQLQVAAANTPGEYRRTEFYGIEGVQGPYTLAPGGTTTFAIVPGSEVVVLDGERLSRGESADYFMDYDAGRITFTSRRPISSSSRITVEFQFSQSEFHRRMMLAGGRWEAAHGWVQSSVLSESDDRGRPVDGTFGPAELAAIAFAGDSASRAVAVEIGSGGDYDTMRVDSTRLAYRYVGAAGGRFSVPFTSVGVGRGDYEAYSVPSGTAYRYVGPGLGSYRIGRTLPLPESHQLVSAGGGLRLGPLAAEVEGAASRFDRNTLSSLEDGDNTGAAGRATLSLETHHGGLLLDRSGVTATVRGVDPRFTPFGTLSAPFEAERWGFAPSVDLDHRREAGVEGFASGRAWGELRGSVGKLTTPEGFASDRRDAAYTRSGFLTARLGYAWAHGRDTTSAFADGHRERIDASLRLNGGWLQPAVQAVSDSRTWPSDSLPQGARTRSAAAQLSTGSRIPWLVSGGYECGSMRCPARRGSSISRDAHRQLAAALARRQAARWRAQLPAPRSRAAHDRAEDRERSRRAAAARGRHARAQRPVRSRAVG
jgi:hypothetical protein